jgi:hypothetical protein
MVMQLRRSISIKPAAANKSLQTRRNVLLKLFETAEKRLQAEPVQQSRPQQQAGKVVLWPWSVGRWLLL